MIGIRFGSFFIFRCGGVGREVGGGIRCSTGRGFCVGSVFSFVLVGNVIFVGNYVNEW